MVTIVKGYAIDFCKTAAWVVVGWGFGVKSAIEANK
jgi:hypothetical protein